MHFRISGFDRFFVNQNAQAIITNCSGSLKYKAAGLNSEKASGFSAIKILAGNTAIKSAIIPQAARRVNFGINSSIPRAI